MARTVTIELRFGQQVAAEAFKNIPKRAKRVFLESSLRATEPPLGDFNWQEGPQESLREMRSH